MSKLEPLNVKAQPPQTIRASIDISILDTKYKGCQVCNNHYPVYITFIGGELSICLGCIEAINRQIKRKLL